MTQTSPTCELRTSTSSCKWRISCFAPSNSTVVLRRLDTWSQKWCLSFVQVEAYQLWEPAFEAPHSPPPTRNSRSAIASLGTDILSPEKSKSKKRQTFWKEIRLHLITSALIVLSSCSCRSHFLATSETSLSARIWEDRCFRRGFFMSMTPFKQLNVEYLKLEPLRFKLTSWTFGIQEKSSWPPSHFWVAQLQPELACAPTQPAQHRPTLKIRWLRM